MRIKRTFHPVGQGAFYSEKFIFDTNNNYNEFNIVYDCGSVDRFALSREILKYQKETKVIDILFISHFHDDHINGIAELLNGVSVKRVVMPYLDIVNRLLTIGSLTDVSLYLLIANPQFFFHSLDKPNVRLTFVYPDQKRPYDNTFDLDKYKGEYIYSGNPIEECFNYTNPISIWEFVPANIFSPNKNITQFTNLMEEKFGSDYINTIHNLFKSLEDTALQSIISDIQDIYLESFGKARTNDTSLLLYSGLQQDVEYDIELINNLHLYCYVLAHKKACCYYKFSGCLYTGDLHLSTKNSEKVKSIFDCRLNNLLTTQVPHHGSSTSDSYDFWSNLNTYTTVLCYGSRNSYHHPSPKTLSTLSSCKKSMIHVTDNSATMFSQIMYIKGTSKN